MPFFNELEYREILAARARLATYKDKIQPYPALPDEPSEPRVIQHIVRHSNMGKQEFDLLHQTAREVKYLREKVAELQTRKVKGISTYKGIR